MHFWNEFRQETICDRTGKTLLEMGLDESFSKDLIEVGSNTFRKETRDELLNRIERLGFQVGQIITMGDEIAVLARGKMPDNVIPFPQKKKG